MHFWDKTVSKREIQKTAQATGDVFGNKITDKTSKASKTSDWEAVSDEHDKEMPKKRWYISRWETENYWIYEINIRE